MYTIGFKSPHRGQLLDEENRKCGIVRCCAEFLSIGNLIEKYMNFHSSFNKGDVN
jgi:hypothetical protein